MIIDTETHLIKKVSAPWCYRDNPLAEPIIWCEHNGDYFVQLMNVAGVDKAICASYDYDDVVYEQKLLSPPGTWFGPLDFQGGAKYTYEYIKRYPNRLIWFDTVNHIEDGAVEWITEKAKLDPPLKGVKWLPGFYGKGESVGGSAVDGPKAHEMIQTCAKLKLPIVISFEDTRPESPYTGDQYVKQLDNLADRFPDVRMALYHVGYGLHDMLPKEPTINLVKHHENLYVSTALFFEDGWPNPRPADAEYPFRGYLGVIKDAAERVGVEKMMFGTDWPWTEYMCKYKQMVTCIKNHATFLDEKQKARFLGGTAAEFLR